jgi:26S proteasome regulatory subunit T2
MRPGGRTRPVSRPYGRRYIETCLPPSFPILPFFLSSLFFPLSSPPSIETTPPSPSQEKKKKWEPPAPPPRVGKKHKRTKDSSLGSKLPTVTPTARCKLRLLKLDRVKDYLLMEEEFVQNQERIRPQDQRDAEDRTRVDELRGSPLSVGTLEEIIDENHAIVSSSVGPEYYVSVLSVVDKTQLEPGCSVLLHNKAMAVVGILQDEADPMVSVMKVRGSIKL